MLELGAVRIQKLRGPVCWYVIGEPRLLFRGELIGVKLGEDWPEVIDCGPLEFCLGRGLYLAFCTNHFVRLISLLFSARIFWKLSFPLMRANA